MKYLVLVALAVFSFSVCLALPPAHGGPGLPPGIDSITADNTPDGASLKLKWSGWQTIPNGGTTNVAPFAISYSGKLYLFTVGIGDQHVYVNTFDGTAWSGPSLFSAAEKTSQPVCGAVCNNKLDIYVYDSAYNPAYIYRHEKSGDGSWWDFHCTDIEPVGMDMFAIANGPAAYLFFRWYDDTIDYWLDSTYIRQAGPCPVPPGDATTDVPLGGCTWLGQLWLFGKGIGDSQPYFTYYKQDGWLGEWFHLYGGWLTDVSIAATVYKSEVFVFVKEKLSNRIHYLTTGDPSGTWWFAYEVPGGQLTAYAVSASVYDGKLYLFAVAGDQTLRYNTFFMK